MEKKDLVKFTKEELLDLAKNLKIIGRYAYTKEELVDKIIKKYRALHRGERTKVTREKKLPKIIEKVKRVITRGRKKKIEETPVVIREERKIEERPPRPYWEAPVEPLQAMPQPQKEEVSVAVAPREEQFVFPRAYGDTKIVLLVRDPWWLHAYWEINREKEMELRQTLGEDLYRRSKHILRVYDITDIDFDGTNAHSYFDIEITGGADNWYIDVGKPNRTWCVDLGLLIPERKFLLICRSNIVRTPRFGMSEITDEEWMSFEEDYWKLFGVAGGFGLGSSPLQVKRAFKRRFREEISSGAPWSLFSFMEKKKERRFWLVVNTELIVYGATEPDAKVTVQGKPIKLRNDGTFTLRFALPDGTQHIPVEAISADGIDKRKITPIVSRRTE
ncbi:MAG: DUF4912 domain-containing protein [Candidatus Omnitrophica bacterium]|nr:DUF4912 domain-containing protein [Candidatus Omnitrophota bacterium]MCM8792918.1 DUF4912 domain-containing protein [Candidatus Omnitrophota bacterium]